MSACLLKTLSLCPRCTLIGVFHDVLGGQPAMDKRHVSAPYARAAAYRLRRGGKSFHIKLPAVLTSEV